MPFWEAQQTFADEPSPPHSFGDISRYADRPVPQHAVQEMIDLVARCPSRTPEAHGSVWNLGWVGGDVVDRVPRTATAYVHRGMMTLLAADHRLAERGAGAGGAAAGRVVRRGDGRAPPAHAG